jgi:hypothetical protein
VAYFFVLNNFYINKLEANMDLWFTLIESFYINLYEDPNYSGGAKNYVPVQRMIIWLLSDGRIKELPSEDQITIVKTIAPIYPIAVKNIVGSRENLDKLQVNFNTDIAKMWNSLPDIDKETVNKIRDEIMSIINHKYNTNMSNLLPPLKVAESIA